MKDKKIYIRADGNEKIGTGHIMRCLSIAEQLSKLTTDITFITADDSLNAVIKEKEYKLICLDSIWNNLDLETNKLCEIIEENNPYAILIDSYFVTKEYLSEIRKYTKVFYIDDLNMFPYPVDSIINYNIYGPDVDYISDNYEKLYLGTKYAPLRSEFSDQHSRDFESVRSILITSGGTDEYNVVGHILETLMKNDSMGKYEFYCVLGRFNAHKRELKKLYGHNNHVHLLMNVKNMSEYMKKSDIAITAGGSTCYELCACGLPSIIYTLADNQLDIAKTFSQQGVAVWAGDVRENIRECMKNIEKGIIKLREKSVWEEKSRMMQSLVDGKGAGRIAQEILK